jgi:uncharacterized oxidoreductase
MKHAGNTILITGGGSGIGRELARRFNDLGNEVIVAGRRRDALDATIGNRQMMAAYTLDVDDPASVRAFARRVTDQHPGLNVLVNCAGVMRYEGLTVERDLRDAEETVATNLLGPIRLMNAFISQLVEQPDAAIINVSSGLAFVPFAVAPTYSATKAAIHSYTVALRERLTGKVEVIEIVPPAVRTDLTPGQRTREDYMPLDDFIEETMTLLQRQPTPSEILVERVKYLRNAEADGRFDQALAALSAHEVLSPAERTGARP